MSSSTAQQTAPLSPSGFRAYLTRKNIIIIVLILFVLGGASYGIYYKVIADQTSESDKKSGMTNLITVPVDKDAVWGDWGECIRDESDGIWKRYRTCVEEGQNKGKKCSDSLSVERCETINGNWSELPPDSEQVCVQKKNTDGTPVKDASGREIWVKTRMCNNPEPRNGGSGCSGDAEVRCEPVNGTWVTPLDSDQVCVQKKNVDGTPVKDASGREIWNKTRTCTGTKFGGICPGDAEVRCEPVNGNWDKNIDQVVCEVRRDNNGNIVYNADRRVDYFKTLTCIPPKYGGLTCPPRSEKEVKMNGNVAQIRCPPRDGSLSDWGECYDESGGKRKQCVCTPPENGGLPCETDYPIKSLISNTDSGYEVKASSFHSDPYQAVNAFDNYEGWCWTTPDTLYNPNTGIYRGSEKTTSSGIEYSGEWLQIKFPDSDTPFRLTGFTITPPVWPRDSCTIYRAPRNFVVAGSNDGTTWITLFNNSLGTGANDWTTAKKTFYLDQPATESYKYYRLIITRVGNQDNIPSPTDCAGGRAVEVTEWKLLGIPADIEKVQCIPCLKQTDPVFKGCGYTYATRSRALHQCGGATQVLASSLGVADPCSLKRAEKGWIGDGMRS
jgi:hypothetical protein